MAAAESEVLDVDPINEIRASVVEALEAKGVLGQIRAHLRAAVYTCVDEHEQEGGIEVPNAQALQLRESAEGLLSLQLVLDLLLRSNMCQTKAVLMAEAGLRDEDLLPPKDLGKRVSSSSGAQLDPSSPSSPLLLQLLQGPKEVSDPLDATGRFSPSQLKPLEEDEEEPGRTMFQSPVGKMTLGTRSNDSKEHSSSGAGRFGASANATGFEIDDSAEVSGVSPGDVEGEYESIEEVEPV